jgi:ribosomal protein S18 acetylase RimI-like enzyme
VAFEIGVLQAEEIDSAAALWEACGLTRPWNDPRADALRALEGSQSTVLAGRLDGQLIATAMIGHDGHRGAVYYLAVAAEHRGKGHGSAMMRAGEDWVGARGIRKMNVMIRSENAEMTKFYRAIGYQPNPVLVVTRWIKDPER